MMPDWWVVPGLRQTSDDLQVPEPLKWASLRTVILVTEKFYAYGIFIGHGYKNWLLQVWILSQGYLSPALCDSHYLEPELPPGGAKEDCVGYCLGSCENCFHKRETPDSALWKIVILSYIFLSIGAKYGHVNVYLDRESPLVPLSSDADGFKERQSKHFSYSGEFNQ